MNSLRFFCFSIIFALATAFVFAFGTSTPAAGVPIQDSRGMDSLIEGVSAASFVPSDPQSPLMTFGDEDFLTPEVNPHQPGADTYPDAFETRQEDFDESLIPLLDGESYTPGGIEATSGYTVTLGRWRNLRPTESYLRDVSLLAPEFQVDCNSPEQRSQGWAVGDAGTILGYCNGVWDQSISVQSRPTRLWGVQAISPTLSISVGEEGAILMYLWDQIAQDWEWTKSYIPVGNQTLFKVSVVPDGTGSYMGWAVGMADATGKGTLVRGTITPTSINGHPTHTYDWQNVTASFPSLPQVSYYYGVHMLSPTDGWAVGGIQGAKGTIIHWDGTKWSLFQEVGNQALHALYMRSATDGWAAGMGGVLYHFDGNDWDPVASPTTLEVVDIGFNADGIGWAVGMGGALLKYTSGQWSLFTDLRTDPFDFRAVDFTSGHGWMVGFNKNKTVGGHILEYADDLWLAVTPATDNALNDLVVLSDNNAWAVGAADARGGTILHWDGKHWQRWYQKDLPIPTADLYTIDMLTPRDGWAAGDPLKTGESAVVLHWDGYRWAPSRYVSPINVRVNSLDMLDRPHDLSYDFGWMVADEGNASGKYEGVYGYWTANHSCQGTWYALRSTSIVSDTIDPLWDAWAVGTSLNLASGEYFLHYDWCFDGYAWAKYQQPVACPKIPPVDPDDGWSQTKLRSIDMEPDGWGYSAGNYKDRASIYQYDESTGYWQTAWCHPEDIDVTPSRIYSVDILKDSNVAWFGGYYTSLDYHPPTKAFIQYKDSTGYRWGKRPLPWNGMNIMHRPIRSIDMSSETMGWAVGDPEDSLKRSVIYQYPFPNFTLIVTPKGRAARPGETATYQITTNSIGGFSADVTLTLGELPPGVTGSVNPTTANVNTPATVELYTSAGTPLGSYEIPITGYSLFYSGDVYIPVWRVFYLRLTVTNNPVYTVSPERGPAGTVVTITGANFGADPGSGYRSTLANYVSWAGVQVPDDSVTYWSDTQIRFIPPDTPNLFLPQKFPLLGEIQVTAGGTASNADYYFQLQNHISSLTYVEDSGRILVTLNGTSFGNDPGPLFRGSSYEHVSMGGIWIPNTDVVAWSNTQIKFYINTNSPSGVVVVTSNGYESNGVMYVAANDEYRVFLPMQRR